MPETLSISPEEAGVEEETDERLEKEVSTDPNIYRSEFENEINFNNLLEERVNQSTEPLNDKETSELADTLRATEAYKKKLWEYRNTHPFIYDRNNYPPGVRTALASYWEEVRLIRAQHTRWDASEILHHDYERSFRHTAAAKELVQAGLAPNVTIGRLLIHFMSIEEGLDTEDPGRDERRMQAFQ